MPLGPLPPENTMRFWVQYFNGQHNHELMLRGRVDTTTGDLIGVFNAFVEELNTASYECEIVGARVALAGSTISNPVNSSSLNGWGTGDMPKEAAPRELAWEARSNDGRKTSYSLFCFSGSNPPNFRFAADEQASLTAALGVLIDAANDGLICTISGLRPIFKTYVNFNYNSYFEVKNRG